MSGLDWVDSPEAAWKFAQKAFHSGHVNTKSFSNVESVWMTIARGRELGIPPATAISEFSAIHGNVEMSASMMLGLARRAGIENYWIEHTDEKATLHLSHNGVEHVHTFTIDDAKRAGLMNNNYKKYPNAMLRARCVSAAVRAFCPDVLLGGSYYVHGEISGPTEREEEMLQEMEAELPPAPPMPDSKDHSLENVIKLRNGGNSGDFDSGEAAANAYNDRAVSFIQQMEMVDTMVALNEVFDAILETGDRELQKSLHEAAKGQRERVAALEAERVEHLSRALEAGQ